jgi:hypothetical protein
MWAVTVPTKGKGLGQEITFIHEMETTGKKHPLLTGLMCNESFFLHLSEDG